MLIKLVRADGSKSETYECMHYTVEKVPETSYAARHGLKKVGVTIEVGRKAPREPSGPTLELQEGDVAYIMNNEGDTIDSIRLNKAESLDYAAKLREELELKEEDSGQALQTEEG